MKYITTNVFNLLDCKQLSLYNMRRQTSSYKGVCMKQICYNNEDMREFIKENKLTVKKFCEMCDISWSQYRRIVNDDNVYIISLYKVSRVLKIPFSEMVKVDDSEIFKDIELYK